jgi:hypothetical protein
MVFTEKTDSGKFKQEIKLRGITRLIHFTPTINLLGIYESGFLYSRQELEDLDINATDILDYIQFNDQIRYDDKTYINLSIERPNSYLFKRFIDNTKDIPYISWCVLSIDPKYIYEKGTLFSVTNAANRHNQNTVGITGDFHKFQMMFADRLTIVSSRTTRLVDRTGLCDAYTTHEQAEVLVNQPIPLADILAVSFPSQEKLVEAKASLAGCDCSVFRIESGLF